MRNVLNILVCFTDIIEIYYTHVKKPKKKIVSDWKYTYKFYSGQQNENGTLNFQQLNW